MVKKNIYMHIIITIIFMFLLFCTPSLIYPLQNYHSKFLINTMGIAVYITVNIFVYLVVKSAEHKNENSILINQYKTINAKLEFEVAEKLEEITRKNIQLKYLYNKDILTNLNNRRYLFKKLDKIIQSSHKTNSKFGLLLIDLNKFKNINDFYGHEVGDLLLIEIASRLLKYDNKKNLVGRQDGDEFIIVCRNIEDEKDLAIISNIIINDFKDAIYINNIPFTIELSIGGVIYPDHGNDKLILMQKADMAMHTSKLCPSSKFNIYKEEINTSRKIKMEELLKNAHLNKEFTLYYQPQFRIDTNEIVGVEALIRWINSDLGFVSPGEFIPLAEETGLIIDIGDWVIETALSQLKEWNELYDLTLEIGINISPVQLSSYSFLDKIISFLNKSEINPALINLEITEASAIKDIEENIKKLEKIRNLGIKVSIDDFGSGYSSFRYLKTFVVDTVKIDMSLINGIDKTNEDYEIAKAIINLGKGLNLNIIAEGVESESQLLVLKNLNCNIVQGYYHEKPLRVIDLESKYFK